MDFYEELSHRENEAIRRARSIRDAERHAAQSFHRPPPAPEKPRCAAPPPTVRPPKQEGGLLSGLLGGNLLRSDLLASSDLFEYRIGNVTVT